jgi:hypothetical protein
VIKLWQDDYACMIEDTELNKEESMHLLCSFLSESFSDGSIVVNPATPSLRALKACRFPTVYLPMEVSMHQDHV